MAVGAIALTSSYDRRQVDNDMWPVWEHVITGTWLNAQTGNLTQAIDINGILQEIIVSAGLNDADVTSQLQIKDNGNNVIFDTEELAESATPYKYNVSEPLSGTIDFVIGPSADPTASGVIIKVTLRGI